MVRQWQNLFYGSRYSQTELNDRGPDFIKLADAYGIAAFRAADEASFQNALGKSLAVLAAGKPALIETIIDTEEKVLPIVPSGKPIDEQIM